MAVLKIHLNRIVSNIQWIDDLMRAKGRNWSLVVKVLSNNDSILRELLNQPVVMQAHSESCSSWSELLGLLYSKRRTG